MHTHTHSLATEEKENEIHAHCLLEGAPLRAQCPPGLTLLPQPGLKSSAHPACTKLQVLPTHLSWRNLPIFFRLEGSPLCPP